MVKPGNYRIVKLINYIELLIRSKLFLISQRTFPGNHFEILMKAGKIVEAALITDLFDAEIVFDQQFACMTHPQLDQKLGKSFAGT